MCGSRVWRHRYVQRYADLLPSTLAACASGARTGRCTSARTGSPSRSAQGAVGQLFRATHEQTGDDRRCSRFCATSCARIARTDVASSAKPRSPARSAIPTSSRSWTPESTQASRTSRPARRRAVARSPHPSQSAPARRESSGVVGDVGAGLTGAAPARARAPGRQARERAPRSRGVALPHRFRLAKGPALTTLTALGVVVGPAVPRA